VKVEIKIEILSDRFNHGSVLGRSLPRRIVNCTSDRQQYYIVKIRVADSARS